MGTTVTTNDFRLRQNNGNGGDLDTDTIDVAITKSTHVPSKSDALWSSISAHEVSGTNYTAGGTAISGVTLALDGDNVEWVHSDIVWAQHAAGFSDGRNYVWKYRTSGRIIMYMAETGNFGNVGGPLTLDGSAATGVLNIVG